MWHASSTRLSTARRWGVGITRYIIVNSWRGDWNDYMGEIKKNIRYWITFEKIIIFSFTVCLKMYIIHFEKSIPKRYSKIFDNTGILIVLIFIPYISHHFYPLLSGCVISHITLVFLPESKFLSFSISNNFLWTNINSFLWSIIFSSKYLKCNS